MLQKAVEKKQQEGSKKGARREQEGSKKGASAHGNNIESLLQAQVIYLCRMSVGGNRQNEIADDEAYVSQERVGGMLDMRQGVPGL